MARPTDDGREDGARSIVAGETGLAHPRPVVNNKSGNLIVTHDDSCKFTEYTRLCS
jgi:hypothetical protein